MLCVKPENGGAKCTGRTCTKNFGDAVRVPVVALQRVLSASCCFSSLLSFWLPWIYSPFPFFMEFCNGRLLQLIECIESTQNEVKGKMIESSALHDAPKSPGVTRARKKIPRRSHCSFAARSPRSCFGAPAEEQHFNSTRHGSELVKWRAPLPRSIRRALAKAKNCLKQRVYGRF